MTSAASSKMNISLYLDSSEGLTYGLLDENNNWIELIRETGKMKNSQVLHSFLYELTKKHNCSLASVKKIFATVGPGSYTGIRLTYGLAKILEWNGAKLYSFYHHHLPKFSGIEDYQFICEAFKGEIFNYSYNHHNESDHLVKEADLVLTNESIFSHNDGFNSDKVLSTFNLLQKTSATIFKNIIDLDESKGPYYFRPLDVEFKVKQN